MDACRESIAIDPRPPHVFLELGPAADVVTREIQRALQLA
jgi:hypothetical protein